MNIKTLKVLKKYANLMIPGKRYEDIVITTFESLPEKDKKQTLREIKMQIMMHNN